MRPSLANVVWLGVNAGTIPGGGGGGGGSNPHGVSFSPGGGVYTPGMTVTIGWTDVPEDAASILVRRYWALEENALTGPFFEGHDFVAPSLTSPWELVLNDEEDLEPGTVFALIFYFRDALDVIITDPINNSNTDIFPGGSLFTYAG